MGILILYYALLKPDALKKAAGNNVHYVILDEESLAQVDSGELEATLSTALNGNNVVFAAASKTLIKAICNLEVHFDLFIPDRSRRIELMNFMVVNHFNYNEVRRFDNNFNPFMDFMEKFDNSFCHKKVQGKDEFWEDNPALLDYLDSVKDGGGKEMPTGKPQNSQNDMDKVKDNLFKYISNVRGLAVSEDTLKKELELFCGKIFKM